MRNKLVQAFCVAFCFFSTISFAQVASRTHQKKEGVNISIAKLGKAFLPIVIAKNASQETVDVANLLAQKLGEMSGAKFEVKKSETPFGITLALQGDFQNLKPSQSFNLVDPGEQQGFEIKTDQKGLSIIGATQIALTYGIYNFLESFGYRYFFPSKNWELIPKLNQLDYNLFVREVPDYYHRRIWAGYGVWEEFKNTTSEWNLANANGGFALKTGHAYEKIIADCNDEFVQHPEYFALISGQRDINAKFPKFCISNAGLRKLVVNHALNEFKKDATLAGYSVDPSDGGGWCECSLCQNLGSISTRVVYLANEVAAGVRNQFPGKRIGIYAYNLHSLPPEIDVDKDVVVSIATSFIKGNSTFDEILNGWVQKKAVTGVREYYDVVNWSWGMPSKSLASNITYLSKTIPRFYEQGARYLNSEASDDWGPSGLGYYLANKVLWNVDDAKRIDDIKKDFFEKSFGPAAITMAKYYHYLDGSTPKIVSKDLLGRMYRLLYKAKIEAAGKADICLRINDLVLYTKFVENYLEMQLARGLEKDEKMLKMMDFSSEIKLSRMIHTNSMPTKHWKSLWKDQTQHAKVSWETKPLPNEGEIDEILKKGIANNLLLDFESVDFTEDLVSVAIKNANKYAKGNLAERSGFRYYFTYVNKDLTPIEINLKGGLNAKVAKPQNIKVRLYNIGGASDNGTRQTLIETNEETPSNGQEHLVVIKPKQQGLHKVVVNDVNNTTSDDWKNYNKIFESKGRLAGTYYFYVPKGTKVLGFFANLKSGQMLNSKQERVANLAGFDGYYYYKVAEGEDGKVWSISSAEGEIKLMTVPAYFSLQPDQFLLPREVAISDHLQQ